MHCHGRLNRLALVSDRCSSTVSDDNIVIRPNTANAAYLFLVIKKKVDAANSEHQQWPQTLSVWHVSSPFCDVIERRACETFKNYRQHYVISRHVGGLLGDVSWQPFLFLESLWGGWVNFF